MSAAGSRPQAAAPAKRGVKTKIIGVCLLFVGVMDSLLAWRGGLEVTELYALFVVVGLALIALGTIRRRGRV